MQMSFVNKNIVIHSLQYTIAIFHLTYVRYVIHNVQKEKGSFLYVHHSRKSNLGIQELTELHE
jgi:hypothetical protein